MATNDDSQAFRDLYTRHHRAVLAYLLRRTEREAAFDAAEEVFLVAWRRRDVVPNGDCALPWLYGVARRVLANQRRSTARFARLIQRAAAAPPPASSDPEAEAIGRVEAEAMLAALATLSEADQEVLRLTFWEELPHADAAIVLGCSPDSVHVRRYRALRRLENVLRRRGHRPSRRPAFLQDRKQEGR